MKKINNYIIEKLIINKDSKLEKASDKYVFVIAFNEYFKKLESKYSCKIYSEVGEPDGWIIPIKDVKKLPKDNGDDDIRIYRIPDDYDNINDFTSDYQEGSIYPEDLNFYEED